MKLLESIKDMFYHRHLKKQQNLDSIQRELTSFQEARKIGMLLKLGKADNELQSILQYNGELTKSHKEVGLLAYSDTKTVPEGFAFDIFCQKDLNFRKIPKGEKVTRFMNTSYDMLIALHRESVQPLEYISLRSKARCRIGYFRPQADVYYDLMLHTQSEGIEPYIAQIRSFLKKMNKKSTLHNNEFSV